MKFFSWLTTLFIIAVIIAALTAPGDKMFENFINKNKGGDTMSCKPVIGNSRPVKIIFVKLFSFHKVSFCIINKTKGKKFPLRIAGKNDSSDSVAVAIGNITVPKIIHSENYLGLFGWFWKL